MIKNDKKIRNLIKKIRMDKKNKAGPQPTQIPGAPYALELPYFFYSFLFFFITVWAPLIFYYQIPYFFIILIFLSRSGFFLFFYHILLRCFRCFRYLSQTPWDFRGCAVVDVQNWIWKELNWKLKEFHWKLKEFN